MEMRAVLRAEAPTKLTLIRSGDPETSSSSRALALTPPGTRPRTISPRGWMCRCLVLGPLRVKTCLELRTVSVGRLSGTPTGTSLPR